jgi:hypothetical protein
MRRILCRGLYTFIWLVDLYYFMQGWVDKLRPRLEGEGGGFMMMEERYCQYSVILYQKQGIYKVFIIYSTCISASI